MASPEMNGKETAYEEATDNNAFVKIGGNNLSTDSDPRAMRGLRGMNSRVGYLRLIDSRQWHYAYMLLLFLDFFGQIVAVSFTSSANFKKYALTSRVASCGFMAVYLSDMFFRIAALRSALFRSNSTIADGIVLFTMCVALSLRFVYAGNTVMQTSNAEFMITVVYLILAAARIILKPRARTFSKKLHCFSSKGDHIRISMDSLRASLRRIPGVTAVAIEMMETDLVIICGRDEGDISRDELMRFLERALLYRPKELTGTEFLSNLRDIDAQSVKYAYGAPDVVKSTLWHWSNQKIDLFCSMLVVCINACINPLQAYFLKVITDKAFPTSPKGDGAFEFPNAKVQQNAEEFLHVGVLGILAICLPFVAGDYGIGYFQSKMISKATERIQNSLLQVILNQDTYFFAERSDGDLNNLFSSDIARVNALWQAVFWNLLNPLISIIFGFGYLLLYDPPTGLIAFAFASVLVTSGPQGLAAFKSKDFGSKNAYVAAEFQNAISCQKVVRAYHIQTPLMDKFKISIESLRHSQFSKDFWSGIVQIYVESAMYIFVAVMTAGLAIKVHNGELSTGSFFSFVTMLSRISTPVTVLGGFMRVAIGNASSLQRLDDIILGLTENDPESEHNMDKDLPQLPKLQNELKLENICFKYDKTSENYILNDLQATIPKGFYTCIVGPSGCGKSTLLACLMQFYEIDSGTIFVDNYDTNKFSKLSFMAQTAVVFQDGGILNGTILDNIRYGNMSASNQDCIEAARLAECHFITGLKDGYETIIGQHATCNLSGGQAQRICLARSLCRKPTLLLLDEATSALDPETEASIVNTLENLSKSMNMTIISVTHRLSTCRNADQILVLNKGVVAEQGTYQNLMDMGSLFHEMVHRTTDDSSTDTSDPFDKKSKQPNDHVSLSVGNIYVEDMNSILETHRALQQFTETLNARSDNTRYLRHASTLNNSSITRRSRRNNSTNNQDDSITNWSQNQNRRQNVSTTNGRDDRGSFLARSEVSSQNQDDSNNNNTDRESYVVL